jgi:hypothetical protein
MSNSGNYNGGQNNSSRNPLEAFESILQNIEQKRNYSEAEYVADNSVAEAPIAQEFVPVPENDVVAAYAAATPAPAGRLDDTVEFPEGYDYQAEVANETADDNFTSQTTQYPDNAFTAPDQAPSNVTNAQVSATQTGPGSNDSLVLINNPENIDVVAEVKKLVRINTFLAIIAGVAILIALLAIINII